MKKKKLKAKREKVQGDHHNTHVHVNVGPMQSDGNEADKALRRLKYQDFK